MSNGSNLSKPVAEVIGQDSNVFNLLGICSKSLKKAGMHEEAKQMSERVFNSSSFDHALVIMSEYCDLQ